VDERASYVNLGEWISYNSHAVFDNGKVELKTYKK